MSNVSYEVILKPSAVRVLRKLQPKRRAQIIAKLKALAVNPYAQNPNVKALKGLEAYRLRIGNYRAIYELVDDKLLLLVLEIGPRGGVYQ